MYWAETPMCQKHTRTSFLPYLSPVGMLWRDFSPAVSTPSQITTDSSVNGIAAKVLKHFSRGVFSLNQTYGLEELYCSLNSVSSTSIMTSFHKDKEITMCGKQLGSY